MADLVAWALCSVAEAEDWLKLASATEDEETTITLLINAVTARFENACGRQIIARALTTRLNGTGADHIFLPQWPVVSIDSLKSLEYDGTDYVVYDTSKLYISESGRLQLLDQESFIRGNLNVEVIYQPGWATVPDDVKVAALQWVADWWETWSKKREPIQSVSVSGQTTVFFNESIPKKVQAVVDLYTLPQFAAGL